MGCAPPMISSAGWKMNTAVPGISARRAERMSASSMATAVCPSWPHACITPGLPDVNGASRRSVSGNASISARQAMVRPGRSPRRMPTTPGPAIPVLTSAWAADSRSAMISAVRRSSNDSSGCRWKSRLSAIRSSRRLPISSVHSIAVLVMFMPSGPRVCTTSRVRRTPSPWGQGGVRMLESDAMTAMRDDVDPAAFVAHIDAAAARYRTPCGTGSMAWRVWGTGRPLVLLHGASGSWTHWIRNISPLAERFRVLVPDMPGFGDSDLPVGPHTADLLADAIVPGLDALIPPPADFDLVGFSFGGVIAGVVAARLARRVRTLVLLGAGALGLPVIPMPTLVPIPPDATPEDIKRVHRENLGLLMMADPRRIDDLAVFVQMENLRRARFKSGTIPTSDVLLKALPSITARIAGIWAARDAFSG